MAESRKYLAELFGTFVLVFIGTGSVVFAATWFFQGTFIGNVGIAFAFGFALLTMVYMIGGISGCHINPAVSIAMLVAGKMKGKDAAIYILMQCIGAVLASAMVWAIALGMPNFDISVNGLGQNGYDAQSPGGFALASCFIVEVATTMVFLLVILGSTSKKTPVGFAGVAIGFALLMIHLVSIPITGTSVNPARSLGPAVMVGGVALTQLWLFWVAPIIGALIAALIWRFVLEEKETPSKA
jgi:aquaporin Z